MLQHLEFEVCDTYFSLLRMMAISVITVLCISLSLSILALGSRIHEVYIVYHFHFSLRKFLVIKNTIETWFFKNLGNDIVLEIVWWKISRKLLYQHCVVSLLFSWDEGLINKTYQLFVCFNGFSTKKISLDG